MLRSEFYDEDHQAFRGAARSFVDREVVPHQAGWERDGMISPGLWAAAGKQGLLGLTLPEHLGGGGLDDYRFRCVLMEELARVGASAVNSAMSLVDDLAAPYIQDLGTAAQQQRLLPGLCAGTRTTAIAMTEPGAGSDLRGITTTAKPDAGGGWVLSGSKTFITNGAHADTVIVVARTPDVAPAAFTLFLVDRGTPGFSSGRPLEKLGQRAENVAELFFDEVRLGDDCRLGEPGRAMAYLRAHLPRERMSIAVYALAAAEAALTWTLEFVRQRRSSGGPLADLPTIRFELADIATKTDLIWSFVSDCVIALNSRTLTPAEAAKAKLAATEIGQHVIDRCLQLHGGYGYMLEYPISRAYVDGRVQTIYGGTSEIMKDIIGRHLVREGS